MNPEPQSVGIWSWSLSQSCRLVVRRPVADDAWVFGKVGVVQAAGVLAFSKNKPGFLLKGMLQIV